MEMLLWVSWHPGGNLRDKTLLSLRFHKPLKHIKILQGRQAVILYSLLIVLKEKNIYCKINEDKVYLLMHI